MQIVSNFELSAKKNLDSRKDWASLTDLKANTNILMPEGFLAYCKAEKKWYIMSCTNENDPSTYSWAEYKTGDGTALTDEQKTNINKIPDLESQLFELQNPLVKPTWKFTTSNSFGEKGSSINKPTFTVDITNIGNATINHIKFYQNGTLASNKPYTDGTTHYVCNTITSLNGIKDGAFVDKITITATIYLTYNNKSYTDSKSIDIKFVSPLYKTILDTTALASVSSDNAENIKTLVMGGDKILQGTKNYTMSNLTFTNSRIAYMYPKSLGALTSVKDANNFEVLDTFTKLEVNIPRTETPTETVAYYIYISTDTSTLNNGKLIFA